MFLDDADWEVLCEVENKARGRINADLWNKYWNVVEKIAVERDRVKDSEDRFKRLIPLLKEFYYERNGKEKTIEFLIEMLDNMINGGE